MPEPADHAYGYALAVLGPGPAATEVATEAARRGGRSRSAVLGYVRHGALARRDEAAAADLDQPAPSDLGELAAALAATRPALERALVDLAARHGLDRAQFGRAVGLAPAAAAARLEEVDAEWRRTLDPVLLARLGASRCPGLAAVLPGGGSPGPETPQPSLGDLLGAAPDVSAHAAACPACQDRLRAMVSVRALLGQRPIGPAPADVRRAGSQSRLLRFPARPAPPPPLSDPDGAPGPADYRPPRRRWALAGVAAGLVAAGAAVGLAATRGGGPGDRVEALVRMPPAGNALTVEPTSVEGRLPPELTLRNAAASALTWVAEPDVGWLGVTPARGRLGPGATTALTLTVGEAPEGEVRASIRVSSADGSATVVRVATTVEHPPDLAVSARGCEVTAVVEDEGELAAVVLHWAGRRASDAGAAPMGGDDTALAGRLPQLDVPLTWWVTALDARGNETRSPEAALPPGSCS